MAYDLLTSAAVARRQGPVPCSTPALWPPRVMLIIASRSSSVLDASTAAHPLFLRMSSTPFLGRMGCCFAQGPAEAHATTIIVERHGGMMIVPLACHCVLSCTVDVCKKASSKFLRADRRKRWPPGNGYRTRQYGRISCSRPWNSSRNSPSICRAPQDPAGRASSCSSRACHPTSLCPLRRPFLVRIGTLQNLSRPRTRRRNGDYAKCSRRSHWPTTRTHLAILEQASAGRSRSIRGRPLWHVHRIDKACDQTYDFSWCMNGIGARCCLCYLFCSPFFSFRHEESRTLRIVVHTGLLAETGRDVQQVVL
ncbi:hypothetical protein V8C44DRAFT_269060 [Trichoderma aethiopicum]